MKSASFFQRIFLITPKHLSEVDKRNVSSIMKVMRRIVKLLDVMLCL